MNRFSLLFLCSILIFTTSCNTENIPKASSTNAKLDSVLSLAKDPTLSTAKRQYLSQKATTLLFKSDFTTQESYLSSIVELNLSLNDSTANRNILTTFLKEAYSTEKAVNIIQAHEGLSRYFENKFRDSAYFHLKKAYDYSIENKFIQDFEIKAGLLLVQMAVLKEKDRDYLGAQELILKAQKIFRENDAQEYYYFVYNLLGITLNGLDENQEALESYKKAEQYIPNLNYNENYKERLQLGLYNNMANVYVKQGDQKEALEIFLKILQFPKIDQYGALYHRALSNFAFNLQKYDPSKSNIALDSINKAINQLEYKGDLYLLPLAYHYKAQILDENSKITEAIKLAKKALEITEESDNVERKLQLLEFLTRKDLKNSADYAQRWVFLSKQLQKTELENQNKIARIELETDEIIENNRKLARQKEVILGVILVIIISFIGITIIIWQRIKNQRLKFEKQQQQTNQEIWSVMIDQQNRAEMIKKGEQKRISEELHDSVLSEMLGVRLLLSGLNKKNDEAAIIRRKELLKRLQGIEEEVRLLSHELNQKAYQQLDKFIIAIQNLVEEQRNIHALDITFDYFEKADWNSLTDEIKINCYRIIQESLQNAIKHSNADHIYVELDMSNGLIKLSIVDNGKGINSRDRGGIGIRNMKSRINKLNGKFSIIGKHKRGTKVVATIPV